MATYNQLTPAEEARYRAQADAEYLDMMRRYRARYEGKNLRQRATPEHTDEVGEHGTCRRCAGTGRFITGSLNGQPTGPGGICYRCQGKGYQTLDDARRNEYRDMHQTVRL